MDKAMVCVKPTTPVLSMVELASLDKSLDAIRTSACRSSEKMWEAMCGLLVKKGGEK